MDPPPPPHTPPEIVWLREDRKNMVVSIKSGKINDIVQNIRVFLSFFQLLIYKERYYTLAEQSRRIIKITARAPWAPIQANSKNTMLNFRDRNLRIISTACSLQYMYTLVSTGIPIHRFCLIFPWETPIFCSELKGRRPFWLLNPQSRGGGFLACFCF